MKIYYKKKFIFGVIYFLLGLCLLTFGFLKGFDVKQVILSILMPLIGISEMYLSTNREAVKQEKVEERDERNQLIKLTSTDKAFRITREICFIAMLIFLVLGAKLEQVLLMGIGLGLAFSFSLLIFSNLFTTIYYENHI